MNVNAIAFIWCVTPSFVRYSHPITIPKKYHTRLRETKLNKETYIIVYPKGETRTAKMYRYKLHHREYYKLTVPTRGQKLPDYLQEKEELFVILIRYFRVSYAILEYIQKPKIRGCTAALKKGCTQAGNC